MLISVHDHVLTKVNNVLPIQDRLRKCQEELTELNLAIHHLMDGRDNQDQVEEEMADVLLCIRSCMLKMSPGSEYRVVEWMKMKASRLELRLRQNYFKKLNIFLDK